MSALNPTARHRRANAKTSEQLDLFATAAEMPEVPGTTTPGPLTFVFGPVSRDRANCYTHLIRAPGDPERSPRAPGRSLLWKRLDDHSPEEWADRIVEHLSDGIPRTFNCIAVELSDFTADVAFESHADEGLWLAVNRGDLMLTLTAPIHFRKAPAPAAATQENRP